MDALPRSLDLGRFQPRVVGTSPTWSHEIRCLVGGYRVAVPELADFEAAASASFVGSLRPEGWELRQCRPADAVSLPVTVDDRWRVVVPVGVRHCLGLTGTAADPRYSFPGRYVAALRVTEDDGGVAIATTDVLITLPATTPGAVAGAATFPNGMTVLFAGVEFRNGRLLGAVHVGGTGPTFVSSNIEALAISGRDGVLLGRTPDGVQFRIDIHDGGVLGRGDTLQLRLASGFDSDPLTPNRGDLVVRRL